MSNARPWWPPSRWAGSRPAWALAPTAAICIVLKGGGKVVEKLESWSEADRKFSYRMREAGPIPVTNYSATLAVKPGPGAATTVVEWRGAFYRGYPNNDPPPDKNDEAAVAAVTGIYNAGLTHLKELLEKK